MYLDGELVRTVGAYYLVSIVVVFFTFRLTAGAPKQKRRILRSAILAAFIGPGAVLGVMSVSPAPPVFALVINLWTAFRYQEIGLTVPAFFLSVVPFYILWPLYYGLLGVFSRWVRGAKRDTPLQPEADTSQP